MRESPSPGLSRLRWLRCYQVYHVEKAVEFLGGDGKREERRKEKFDKKRYQSVYLSVPGAFIPFSPYLPGFVGLLLTIDDAQLPLVFSARKVFCH